VVQIHIHHLRFRPYFGLRGTQGSLPPVSLRLPLPTPHEKPEKGNGKCDFLSSSSLVYRGVILLVFTVHDKTVKLWFLE